MVKKKEIASDNINPATDNRQIFIKGARVHNLKNIDVTIPRGKLVVVTGLSGSGKSSLAFDTLYAEGQRRYVESLSSYARQFMGRLNKPDVDYISGISPAVAIEQKVSTHNPRSTVGTQTELYDYIKLLFARAGVTYSPISGKEVKRATEIEVVNYLHNCKAQTTVHVFVNIRDNGRTFKQELSLLQQQGFSRINLNDALVKIEDVIEQVKEKDRKNCLLLIDRFIINKNEVDDASRWADSIKSSFYEGAGTCIIETINNNKKQQVTYNSKFELDGITFTEPSLDFFSFNNPVGACKKCEGYGSVLGIDPDLVIPDKNLSIYEGAIACWKGEVMGEWLNKLTKNAIKFDFPIHRAYKDLTKQEQEILWTGNKYFEGLDSFFSFLETQTYKIQYRVMLSRFRGKTICNECKGTRLRKDASYVKINNSSITEILLMQVKDALVHFNNLVLTTNQLAIAEKLLIEIKTRLSFLIDVGLGYLTLNRLSNTLSGGESQRINLATSLGSCLVGSLYVLDEPSIGLHARDTQQLIKVLQSLKQMGNTVVIVEHDEEIMRAADYIIDIGPEAGNLGGKLIYEGDFSNLLKSENSLTADYLTNKKEIALPKNRRKQNFFISLNNVSENNLKDIDVKFPLNNLCVVSGVSGSGKSSLIKRVLYPAVKKVIGGMAEHTGKHSGLHGDYQKIKQVEFVDQNPIGRSSRSNPVTYLKAFDEIRTLFSTTKHAQLKGFKTGHFSFNVAGGRCDNCEGEGVIHVSMQFMADVELLCESCNGKRFKEEILEVTYQNKNIYEILTMTVQEALDFFETEEKASTPVKKILAKLHCLNDVGLSYVQLGQSSSTLSGGEAQRIKLAYYLSLGEANTHTLFIFDEPTTGLHFHDIKKLLDAFEALLKQGHSIILIEHNIEIIKCADWLIDIGPEGGDDGGYLLYQGIPEGIVNINESYTAKYLKEKL